MFQIIASLKWKLFKLILKLEVPMFNKH